MQLRDREHLQIEDLLTYFDGHPDHEVDLPLVELTEGSFASLSSLEFLSLRNSFTGELTPETFRGLESLTSLTLYENDFYSGPLYLESLPSLETFYFY